jgi:hypothetical protein
MGACFLLTKVWVPDGGVRYLLHLYTQQLSSPAKHYQPANLIASQRSVDSNIFMRIPERQSNTVDFPAAIQHGTTTETWTTEHERGLQSLIRILEMDGRKPFSSVLLKKAVHAQVNEAPEILRILLRHNTHPIDEKLVLLATGNRHGAEMMATVRT